MQEQRSHRRKQPFTSKSIDEYFMMYGRQSNEKLEYNGV